MTDTTAKKTLCIKISERHHHALKLAALMEGMTQSALMEKLIEEFRTKDHRENIAETDELIARSKARARIWQGLDELTEIKWDSKDE